MSTRQTRHAAVSEVLARRIAYRDLGLALHDPLTDTALGRSRLLKATFTDPSAAAALITSDNYQ